MASPCFNSAGGTINMTGGGNITNTALMGFGTIAGANNITVISNLVVGGLNNSGTLNLAGDLTLLNPFSLAFDLGGSPTIGGGVNDYINLTGNLNLNDNPLSIAFTGTPVSGSTYRLIDFTGARSGVAIFTNATRSALGVDQTTPGHLNLVVTNWAPATLVWNGSNTNVWNASFTNWNAGNVEKFYQYDDVVFDDSSANTLLWVQGTVNPSSITINGSKNYSLTNRSSFIANGNISGFTGITKNGTGTFKLGITNTFTGPININNGVFQVYDPTATSGTATVLGHPNSPLNVLSGGTYDYTGVGFISNGKRFYIAGNGYNGMGAITNSVSNSGATVNGFLVTLTADALLAADVGGIGLRGLTSSGPFYSGVLDLNGYTLTKSGAARFSHQDVVATNSGSINFNGGTLQLQNSILDGSGTLAMGNGTLITFAPANGATSYVGKAISTLGNLGIVAPVSSGAFSGSSPIPVVFGSTINLGGTLVVTNAEPIILNNVVSGSFGITKAFGASNLVLNAANTYSGQTLVNAGTLSLGSGGSLNNSPHYHAKSRHDP